MPGVILQQIYMFLLHLWPRFCFFFLSTAIFVCLMNDIPFPGFISLCFFHLGSFSVFFLLFKVDSDINIFCLHSALWTTNAFVYLVLLIVSGNGHFIPFIQMRNWNSGSFGDLSNMVVVDIRYPPSMHLPLLQNCPKFYWSQLPHLGLWGPCEAVSQWFHK